MSDVEAVIHQCSMDPNWQQAEHANDYEHDWHEDRDDTPFDLEPDQLGSMKRFILAVRAGRRQMREAAFTFLEPIVLRCPAVSSSTIANASWPWIATAIVTMTRRSCSNAVARVAMSVNGRARRGRARRCRSLPVSLQDVPI